MNVPLMKGEIAPARSLAGKVSLITGSTSGIGLGIARALAAAGSAIVLNGFGGASCEHALKFLARMLALWRVGTPWFVVKIK